MKKGAWANIPLKSNRSDPICFSPYLYVLANQVERFFNRIKHVVGWRRARTSWPPTTLPSFSSRQSGYGCVFMSPRPSTALERRTTAQGKKSVIPPAASGTAR